MTNCNFSYNIIFETDKHYVVFKVQEIICDKQEVEMQQPSLFVNGRGFVFCALIGCCCVAERHLMGQSVVS